MEENKNMPSNEMPKMEEKQKESGKKSGGWGKAIVAFVLGLVIGAAVFLPSSNLFQGAVPGLVTQDAEKGKTPSDQADMVRLQNDLDICNVEFDKAKQGEKVCLDQKDRLEKHKDELAKAKSPTDEIKIKRDFEDLPGRQNRGGDADLAGDVRTFSEFTKGKLISILASEENPLPVLNEIFTDLLQDVPKDSIMGVSFAEEQKNFEIAQEWLSREGNGKHLGDIVRIIGKEFNEYNVFDLAYLSKKSNIVRSTKVAADEILGMTNLSAHEITYDIVSESRPRAKKLYMIYTDGFGTASKADFQVALGDDENIATDISILSDTTLEVDLGGREINSGDQLVVRVTDESFGERPFDPTAGVDYFNIVNDTDQSYVLNRLQ